MKPLKFARSLLASVIITTAGAANATGIPVVDISAIATQVTNQLETITQWASQFQQMKAQIDQYKAMYDAVRGGRGMGLLLNNPILKQYLPEDLVKMASDIQKTVTYINERKKYPTYAGLPKTNALYDVVATQNSLMKDLYSKSQDRLKQIQLLMASIDTAEDPAAKQDLTNRLINEQNAIAANQNLVQVLQVSQKQDLDFAANAAVQEYSCKEFKRASC